MSRVHSLVEKAGRCRGAGNRNASGVRDRFDRRCWARDAAQPGQTPSAGSISTASRHGSATLRPAVDRPRRSHGLAPAGAGKEIRRRVPANLARKEHRMRAQRNENTGTVAAVHDRRMDSPSAPIETAVTDRRYRHVPRSLWNMPSRLLLALIRVYQRTLSPALPVLTMGQCSCRFSPTCSHYAAEAIRIHGAVRGGWLALRRLVKCTPLHPGGFDPVPARGDQGLRPRALACRSARPSTPRPHFSSRHTPSSVVSQSTVS